jgi:hypothetical protein
MKGDTMLFSRKLVGPDGRTRRRAHAFSLPTVREIPPVQRPGTFDATW